MINNGTIKEFAAVSLDGFRLGMTFTNLGSVSGIDAYSTSADNIFHTNMNIVNGSVDNVDLATGDVKANVGSITKFYTLNVDNELSSETFWGGKLTKYGRLESIGKLIVAENEVLYNAITIDNDIVIGSDDETSGSLANATTLAGSLVSVSGNIEFKNTTSPITVIAGASVRGATVNFANNSVIIGAGDALEVVMTQANADLTIVKTGETTGPNRFSLDKFDVAEGARLDFRTERENANIRLSGIANDTVLGTIAFETVGDSKTYVEGENVFSQDSATVEMLNKVYVEKDALLKSGNVNFGASDIQVTNNSTFDVTVTSHDNRLVIDNSVIATKNQFSLDKTDIAEDSTLKFTIENQDIYLHGIDNSAVKGTIQFDVGVDKNIEIAGINRFHGDISDLDVTAKVEFFDDVTVKNDGVTDTDLEAGFVNFRDNQVNVETGAEFHLHILNNAGFTIGQTTSDANIFNIDDFNFTNSELIFTTRPHNPLWTSDPIGDITLDHLNKDITGDLGINGKNIIVDGENTLTTTNNKYTIAATESIKSNGDAEADSLILTGSADAANRSTMTATNIENLTTLENTNFSIFGSGAVTILESLINNAGGSIDQFNSINVTGVTTDANAVVNRGDIGQTTAIGSSKQW